MDEFLVDSDRLLTVVDVATRMACSRAHVYRLVREGELLAVDISSSSSGTTKIRIRESDVERFVTSRTSETP